MVVDELVGELAGSFAEYFVGGAADGLGKHVADAGAVFGVVIEEGGAVFLEVFYNGAGFNSGSYVDGGEVQFQRCRHGKVFAVAQVGADFKCVVLAFGEVALHGVDNVAIAVGEAVELARAFVESYVFALRVGDGDNIERV